MNHVWLLDKKKISGKIGTHKIFLDFFVQKLVKGNWSIPQCAHKVQYDYQSDKRRNEIVYNQAKKTTNLMSHNKWKKAVQQNS